MQDTFERFPLMAILRNLKWPKEGRFLRTIVPEKFIRVFALRFQQFIVFTLLLGTYIHIKSHYQQKSGVDHLCLETKLETGSTISLAKKICIRASISHRLLMEAGLVWIIIYGLETRERLILLLFQIWRIIMHTNQVLLYSFSMN